jgi:hypothetical protein
MKSDYNGLVEQSEINQSVDENFNKVNVRLRTEKDIAEEVPEEAEETIKGKAVLMRWMLSSTPSKPWTIWR